MSTWTASNEVIHVEGGEQIYPCRCGETHRGPYAAYDYGHHNCFHRAALSRLGADDLMCPECGEMFRLSLAEGDA